jgi:2-polyprenyl-3-methyl-5-hydroxy-6-metoxy-1,4-benzoquinol methylase
LHEYGDNFYRFLASFAVRSAEQIVPLLSGVIPINSIADFGCGEGAWLSVWRKAGARVIGVDGPYVDQQYLMIDADEFRAADLSQPIDLGRRFDVVQSLEVAEHLPNSRASEFIGTLTSHGPLVMFLCRSARPGRRTPHQRAAS